MALVAAARCPMVDADGIARLVRLDDAPASNEHRGQLATVWWWGGGTGAMSADSSAAAARNLYIDLSYAAR
jgi:hypothetical protein